MPAPALLTRDTPVGRVTLTLSDELLLDDRVVALVVRWTEDIEPLGPIDLDEATWSAVSAAAVDMLGGAEAARVRDLVWRDAGCGPDACRWVGVAHPDREGGWRVDASDGRWWRVRDGVAVEVVRGRGGRRPPGTPVKVMLSPALLAGVDARRRPGEDRAAAVARLLRSAMS